MGDMHQFLRKQDSIVSAVAKRLSPCEGTYIDSDFIAERQAHLQRISTFFNHIMEKKCGRNMGRMDIAF